MPLLDDDDYTLYADRPEWSDVKPIPQTDEGANPIAPIFYTMEYKDVTDYFRGIVKIREMSQRVLELTEAIIRLNPGHYSAWQYRYRTLLAINAPLDKELELMDEIATTHLKTYQVWHHRRLLLTHICTPAPELKFIERGLREVDQKNYHTWSYREWILAHFNEDFLWEGEIPFIEDMIEIDVRNNSAWHHRFFVVFESGVREGDEDRDEVLKRELAFAKEKIALAPNNGSAWNYLRGVLDRTQTSYSILLNFVTPYASASPISKDADFVDLENPLPSPGAELPCSLAIEFLADIYEAEKTVGAVHKAVELWKTLAQERDTIRKRYWEFRIREATADVKN